jgi:hypothetical protein
VVKEGDDLNILCQANGFPLPNITWFDVNKNIKSRGVGHASLSIHNITRGQSGTYQCQARNNPNELPVTCTENIVNVQCKTIHFRKTMGRPAGYSVG